MALTLGRSLWAGWCHLLTGPAEGASRAFLESMDMSEVWGRKALLGLRKRKWTAAGGLDLALGPGGRDSTSCSGSSGCRACCCWGKSSGCFFGPEVAG